MTDNDIVIIDNVYSNIANYYGNITPKQVKNDISYILNSRRKNRKNFEKVFVFEYDQYYYTNKTIIEEIAHIIKEEFIN